MFLLSVAIFFCILLNSNTRADHDEVITEEDLKAFEEALADIRRQSHRVRPEAATPTELSRRLSGRSKKLNSNAFQPTPFPRKRGRQRPNHLRRLGIFLRKSNTTSKLYKTNQRRETLRKHVFNFRKRKRKQLDGKIRRISGGSKKKGLNVGNTSKEKLTRVLFKGKDRISQERSAERGIFHPLRDPPTTSASPPSTTVLNMLKISPVRHRAELGRRATTRSPLETSSFSESTSTVAALEALIAALENIQPKEFDDDLFVDETTPFSTSTKSTTHSTSTTSTSTSTTPSTTTTSSTAAITTSESPETTTRKSRPRGSSFKISADGPAPPSIADEARRLSLQIESNFVEETGPEPPSAPLGPPAPGPPGAAPSGAPPGAQPPSDFVVNELNEADDFLAVASKLQLLRRKSTRL